MLRKIYIFSPLLSGIFISFYSSAALIPATLPELLPYAVKNNVSLPVQQAQLNALTGETQSAEALLFNNPVIDWNSGKRRNVAGNPDQVRQSEWGAGISQTFEVAGQQGYRQASARSAMNTFREESLDTRNQVVLTTSILFYQILVLQEKVRLESDAVALYSRAESLVARQRQSGSATRLDNNLATIEHQLASNQLLAARQALQDTRNELARYLLTSEDAIPEMRGDFDNTAKALPYTYVSLNARLENTPGVRTLEWQEKSASAELDLQKAARIPDVTLGVSYTRDGPDNSREDLTTLSVSVPLPFFQRNEAGIGQATTALTRSQLNLNTFRNAQKQQLKNQWNKLDNLKSRVEILNKQILPAADMNKRLTLLAQESGQSSLPDVLLTSQQILNAQRTRLDTLLEYQTTRLTLENIANWRGQELP